MPSIFIGSATEDRDRFAEPIARVLGSNGISPRRWWSPDQFPPGALTIERLFTLSREVDGAIFVLSGLDKTWYRGRQVDKPRDNLLLEWGIFASVLGRDRVIIATEQEVELPSDLHGLTYVPLRVNDPDGVAEQVARHFRRLLERPASATDKITLDVDRAVIELVSQEALPPTWVSRALYFGTDGGRGWLTQSRSREYDARVRPPAYRSGLNRVMQGLSVATMVSLGSGDGMLDRELLLTLRVREPALTYLPVDISDLLLEKAISRNADVARIPMGILSDCEERLGFIMDRVAAHSAAPRLYVLLGYTMGNLDRGERNMLLELRRHMTPSDVFVVDVSTVGDQWDELRDPARTVSHREEGHRKFLATGLARRVPSESRENIARRLMDSVKGACQPHPEIDDAVIIDFVDEVTGVPLTKIVRYRWATLRPWIETQVKMVWGEDGFVVGNEGVVGYGVVVLRVPENG